MGAGCPRQEASTAAVRKVSRWRCCWAQVALMVKMRSTNVLPSALCAPKQPFRHSTAGRSACSAALLVRGRTSTAPLHGPAIPDTSARAHHSAVPLLSAARAEPAGSVPSPLGATRGRSSLRGTGARGEISGGSVPRNLRPRRPHARPDPPGLESCESDGSSTVGGARAAAPGRADGDPIRRSRHTRCPTTGAVLDRSGSWPPNSISPNCTYFSGAT